MRNGLDKTKIAIWMCNVDCVDETVQDRSLCVECG